MKRLVLVDDGRAWRLKGGNFLFLNMLQSGCTNQKFHHVAYNINLFIYFRVIASPAGHRDESILLFFYLFFFPAILLFFTYFAQYFARNLSILLIAISKN